MKRYPQSWVKAGEHGWVSVKLTTFIDVEEGDNGDEMTFEYQGEKYKSVIAQGSRPG